jgi:hypothetical protein
MAGKTRQGKKTIEGIIEGSPIPTFVINKKHKIMLWSKACTELAGLDSKEMIGTDRQSVPFYPEKRPVIADLIIDNDVEGLKKYYGSKMVQESAVVKGAYEARVFFENLGGKKRQDLPLSRSRVNILQNSLFRNTGILCLKDGKR